LAQLNSYPRSLRPTEFAVAHCLESLDVPCLQYLHQRKPISLPALNPFVLYDCLQQLFGERGMRADAPLPQSFNVKIWAACLLV
jgi:hypothetical protein